MLINNIKRFSKLPAKQKAYFMEAYMTLGLMRAAILNIPFKRLTRTLKQSANKKESLPVDGTQMQTATVIGKVIGQAAAHTPWESACLAQSLTFQRMLKKRSIPGAFYLGVAKDETAVEKMKAHAWSECGNTILTGKKGHEEFTVISVFEWGKP